jgi:putative transposase
MLKQNKPHAKNLRKGRISLDNQAYLITTVTANREKVFADLIPGRILVNCLRKQHDLGQMESVAFVVMPDHLHWLFVLRQGISLSQVMKAVKGSSSRLIGGYRRHKLGELPQKPLWQEGFHDHALRGEEDLRQKARYIVANPLRAELVSWIGDYALWDAKWLE